MQPKKWVSALPMSTTRLEIGGKHETGTKVHNPYMFFCPLLRRPSHSVTLRHTRSATQPLFFTFLLPLCHSATTSQLTLLFLIQK